MVETRSRRKSTAPAAAAADTPSSSGRQAVTAAGADGTDWAEVYRQKHLQQLREEQASIFRRVKGRVYLLYHQQAMTWGWYMLEPWEALLWFACLGLLAYLVLSACFANGQSICHTTLVAVRNSLAQRGAKLLALAR